MSETADDQLQIRCSKCGQRFKVGPELQGRIVECGRCENRFRVNDEVIQRTKKFYPGEKVRDPSLDRFSRTSMATMSGRSVDFQAVTYAGDVSPDMIEPPSVARVMAGLLGMSVLVLGLLVFVVSGSTGGWLGSVSLTGRVMLAVFLAGLGSWFFIYANIRLRGRAVLISGVLSAALVAMPFVFAPPEREGLGEPDGGVAGGGKGGTGGSEGVPALDDPLSKLKQEIGYAPLEKELEGAMRAGKPEAVAGVWLRNMHERNRFQIRDYMIRSTGAGEASHLYPRSNTDFLFVLTGVDRELKEIAVACERIGRVERIVPPLQVIEVVVDNERFVEGPVERMNQRDDAGFYALNLRELESIDLGRATRAVERLMDAPPTQFRSDIVRRMIELLEEAELQQQGKIAKSLTKWSVAGDGADEAVLKVVAKADAAGRQVPDEAVRFLVLRQEVRVLPVLHRLWLGNPEEWETIYEKMGQAAEKALLGVLVDGEPRELQSALRILSRVGTGQSLPALEALLVTSKGEVRLLVEKALEQIRARSGR